MGVGIYYFYHRFELKAFEGRHIRMPNEQFSAVSWQEQVIFIYYIILHHRCRFANGKNIIYHSIHDMSNTLSRKGLS
jgi:hypothetical protein